MREPVLTKKEMYRRMTAGEFGNTNPAAYDGAHAWDMRTEDYPLWGVRSKVAGDPLTRLNVPADKVWRYCYENGLMDANISPMVKAGSVQWEGDICRGFCSGNVAPEPGSWRTHMKKPRLWEGSAANALLRQYLNDNSFEDLMILLEEYPDHAIELSILDHCYGTVPGRNAVVWECRRY